jgi:D-glycero-alpha-D-manno-heptose 1-phosphate guanylyltransferase
MTFSLGLSDIDAYILCGGLGKRLRSVLGASPKPMVLLGDKPFLDILLAHLTELGFRRFILGIGYQAQFIKDYYKKNNLLGYEIIFSQENKPIGTGGALKKARNLIKSDPFFVFNGDSLANFNPLGMLRSHQQKQACLTILLKKMKDCKDYGHITLGKEGRMRKFNEKGCDKQGFINAGIYLCNRSIFKLMPGIEGFSLENDFFPDLLEEKVYGYKSRGFFFDIGTPERYRTAEKYFLKKWKK